MVPSTFINDTYYNSRQPIISILLFQQKDSEKMRKAMDCILSDGKEREGKIE